MNELRSPIIRASSVCRLVAALGAVLLSALAFQPSSFAQAQPLPPAASIGASRTKPAVRPTATARSGARSTWTELSPGQQAALAPLASTWPTLSEAQKRKWLAVSRNYRRMPAEEQARLHSRMTEWAALTPQQRTAARLNFAETKKVPARDKRALWEAYKALPPEEKRRLAAGAVAAKPPPPPTAVAVKPVPPQQLARVPKPRKGARSPRIAVAPPPPATLLAPQPAAQPAPSVPQN